MCSLRLVSLEALPNLAGHDQDVQMLRSPLDRLQAVNEFGPACAGCVVCTMHCETDIPRSCCSVYQHVCDTQCPRCVDVMCEEICGLCCTVYIHHITQLNMLFECPMIDQQQDGREPNR